MKRVFFKKVHGKLIEDQAMLKLPKDTSPPKGQGVLVPWPFTELAISTYPQEDTMLHSTIASMVMGGYTGQVNLLIDRPNDEYVKIYKHHKNIRAFPLQQEEWEGVRDNTTGWLATHNYLRALSLGGNNLVICEDDVVFHDGWFDKMVAIAEEIEKNGHEHYVLSLYSPTLLTTKTDKTYAMFPVERFVGCQCVFFPRRMIQSCMAFFVNALNTRAPDIKPDVVLGYWAECGKFPIFTPKYSLVQHVGIKSSMNSMWHCSPSFTEVSI